MQGLVHAEEHIAVYGRPIARASAASCTVLVVDDISDNRELYAEVLRQEGYDVISARDGAEAVEAVERHQPGIVLMDLGMPVVDGYESTRRIRDLAKIAQPYIVALSAFTDRTSRRRSLEAGCNEFLHKPLLPSDLTRKLAAIREGTNAVARTRAR